MLPMVPAEIVLRDFAFLPLDVVRLRDSDLAVKATGDEFRAAVMLWCVAWHQIPAASLPDDDQSLATYAGFGRDLKAWIKVRAGALRGFVLCDDGRLYHAVLAEKAIEAWEGKLRLRHRRECERIKKAAQRAKTDAVYPTFEEWKAHVAATGDDKWSHVPGDHPSESLNTSPGTAPGRPENVPSGVPGESLPLKGQGIGDRGQGTGEVVKAQGSLRSPSSTAAPSTGRETEPDEVNDRKAKRIAQITDDAIEAFNAKLGKPNGELPMVIAGVGMAKRRRHVTRCLRVARDMCGKLSGSTIITKGFWEDYFELIAADDFKSGRREGGKDHQNWTPSFEYLTREQTMLDVLDRSGAVEAA